MRMRLLAEKVIIMVIILRGAPLIAAIGPRVVNSHINQMGDGRVASVATGQNNKLADGEHPSEIQLFAAPQVGRP